MRVIIFIIIVLFLSACQATHHLKSITEIKKLSNKIDNNPKDILAIASGIKNTQKAITHDAKKIQQLYNSLEFEIEKVWGSERKALPGKKRYVKYSNEYQARAIVDFDKGWVKVETVATDNPKDKLSKAIYETLLTTDDPITTDIFSSKAPNLKGEPFLYPQVQDHDGKPVRYQWRAKRYANYLVNNQLTQSVRDGNQYTSVLFNLVKEHTHLRHLKYSEYVLKAAKQYHISPALIYAVIDTESSFNPYAVSHANAYGLMQVIPSTAGRDVYKLEKSRSGQPTKSILMQPKHNIDIGTAYLKILNTRYLKAIKHQQSREYTIISAYNGGAGNVLKTYDSNRATAMKKINAQSPPNVYKKLRYEHPLSESRRYLEKVTKAKSKYF
ncbi:lytic murein transglycosylase [Pseudoalteromonas sp. NBT06-2]|uniref:murein transglycosylase domain-containing protein n=1 Tax=Pseudoalteromonas sp. NBT06-2 TaxID=2025950 RepID=UPI000BA4F4BD|nr:murein transglycosylase domain-containing protein [Pseudoalteromonas sp. NBT06-2]PAJ73395.1 lytic murein transglycosylase [Pseudoalteromonas sp. NBT06-2]